MVVAEKPKKAGRKRKPAESSESTLILGDKLAVVEELAKDMPLLADACKPLDPEAAAEAIKTCLLASPDQVQCSNWLRDQKVTVQTDGLWVDVGSGAEARAGLIAWSWLGEALFDPESHHAEDGGVDRAEDGDAVESPPAAEPAGMELAIVPVELIDVAENDRKHFDQAELDALAETLKTHGLLQPILVRREGARYRLVAGERRLRAAKLAGLENLPAKVVPAEADDAWIAEARLIENDQRVDLSPIERAQALVRMLEATGLTHEALAAQLGKSQAFVTNHVRLLKLPKKWQQRVISGEMPNAHARALVKYAEIPEVLKAVEQDYFEGSWREPLGNDKQFAEELKSIAKNESEPMTGKQYEYQVGKEVKIFEPTEAERKKLRIVELDGEERAFNVELWKELRDKQLAALVQDKPAKGSKAAEDDAGPTAAELRAKAKKQADQFARRLDEWRTNWLRWILARVVIENGTIGLTAVVVRTLGPGAKTLAARAAELVHFDGKVSKPDPNAWAYRATPELLAALAAHPPIELLLQFASDWLWSEDEPQQEFAKHELEALAVAAKVDLEAEWKRELAGPLAEAYFNLHSKAQLIEVAGELGVTDFRESDPKSEIVRAMLDAPKSVTGSVLPEEIKRLNPPAKKKSAAKTTAAKKTATKKTPARKPAKRKK